MSPLDPSDILIEVIEIFIFSILYARELYPPQIFEKRKMLNSPVYTSIYPPLNEYIKKVLKTAKELKENSELQQVEIVIYQDDATVYETYIFEIDDKNSSLFQDDDDLYLVRFEEEIRKSLIMLSGHVKDLNKLPKDAKFKINLHTSQSGFVKMSNKPAHQEFPWLQQTGNSLPDKSKVSILPLTFLEGVGVQIYVEIFQ